MTDQRVIVFGGNTFELLRGHQKHFEFRTNSSGAFTLGAGGRVMRYVQVWADHKTLCLDTPNLVAFSLQDVRDSGVSAPNHCGSKRNKPEPGVLVIPAREPTFREKLNW